MDARDFHNEIPAEFLNEMTKYDDLKVLVDKIKNLLSYSRNK